MTESQPNVAEVVAAMKLPAGVSIRAREETDFPAVQRLSAAEGWTTPIERPDDMVRAWQQSRPALVAVADDRVIGFLRALGDGGVTTYVAELLVAPAWRWQGVASALLEACLRLCPGSRLDLLASDASGAFYSQLGFRSFPGFRLSLHEREGS